MPEGSFENVEEIGSGGFGTVWRCVRESDGAECAKKVLNDDATDEMVRRFKREVRMLESLDHPNIVKVLGKRLKDEPYFYRMPLYEHCLWDIIDEVKEDPDRIATIFTQVLDAVEHAHDQGTIHRDLKPGNILLNSDGDVVVADFGLGVQHDTESTRQTTTGKAMGTVFYTAPEQLLNAKDADVRSDVFGLGCILYEMHTGVIDTVVDASTLPAGPAYIVQKCRRRDPDERFQDVSELKEAWEAFAQDRDEAADAERIEELQISLRSADAPDFEEVEEFIGLLLANEADADVIHKQVMLIPDEVLGAMLTVNEEATRRIMGVFLPFTAEQGWSFEYTDKIGDWCERAYDALDDVSIRAELMYCLMEVGYSHNRWHVMGTFEEILYRKRSTAEARAIADRLATISQSRLISAADRLQASKLPPTLRAVFPFPEAGDEDDDQ